MKGIFSRAGIFKMCMRNVACMVLTLFICSPNAISQDKKLIQFTGKVIDELLQPMPFAHVLVMENYHGAITNVYGNFSLVVEEKDSVLISAVGYKTKYVVIPENLTSPFLNKDIVLTWIPW
jgi:hypothetical protein